MRFVSFFFFLSFTLSGSIKSKDVLKLFEETALTWLPGSTTLAKRDQKLAKKRTNDLKVSLKGDWSSESKSAVSKAMNEINELINVRICFSDEAESKFLFLYKDPDLFTAKIDDRALFIPSSINWSWYIYYSEDKPYSISEGYGYINSDKTIDEKFVYSATLRILAGSLGFTNRTDNWKFRDSFFYNFCDFETNNFGDTGLTDLDRAVVKLLYQKEIKPGLGIREIKRMCSTHNLLKRVGGR